MADLRLNGALVHPLIVTHPNGLPLDHVCLGAPDYADALDVIERQCGVRPLHLGNFDSHSRAVIRFENGPYLEILGPAPSHRGPQDAVTARAAALATPAILFWYVGVRDINAFADHLTRHDHAPLERQDIRRGGYDYGIAGLQGGVDLPVVPWFIEWRVKPPVMDEWPMAGALAWFAIEHDAPERVQSLFDHLGIDVPIERGSVPRMTVGIETDRGFMVL